MFVQKLDVSFAVVSALSDLKENNAKKWNSVRCRIVQMVLNAEISTMVMSALQTSLFTIHHR